jgi:hypothetical protein
MMGLDVRWFSMRDKCTVWNFIFPLKWSVFCCEVIGEQRGLAPASWLKSKKNKCCSTRVQVTFAVRSHVTDGGHFEKMFTQGAMTVIVPGPAENLELFPLGGLLGRFLFAFSTG